MEHEHWAPVIGFEGLYEVSDQGRVRGLDRFGRGGRFVLGRMKKLTPNKDGYLTVSLSDATGQEFRRQVHRLVLEAFVGPAPEGMESLHGPDHTPSNCRLDNLRWGTRTENNDERTFGEVRSRPGLCPRDHPVEGPNLVPSRLRRGQRICLACNRAGGYVRDHPGADLQTVSDRYYEELIAATVSA